MAKTQKSKLNQFMDIQIMDYFRLLFDNTSDAISLLKMQEDDIIYLYSNIKHQNLVGKKSDEILYKSIYTVFDTDFASSYEFKCKECIRKKQSLLIDHKIVIHGKKTGHFCRLTPVFIQDDTYIFSMEIPFEQIQEWMDQNHISLTKFDKMFDSHFSIMMLVDPKTYQIMNVNPAAAHFYGYSAIELTHMNLLDIHVNTTRSSLHKIMETAEKTNRHFLFHHRRKDGSIRFVEIDSSPLEIDHDLYLFFIVSDVTEREQNKKELYEEKTLLSITMDSISDVVITTDIRGKITYSNKTVQNLLGMTANDILYKNFKDVFPIHGDSNFDEYYSIIETVCKTHQKQELTGELSLTEARNISVELSASPILNKNEQICGVVIILRDITLANEKKKKIEFFSYHDALTGLYNRRFYYDYIDTFQKEDLFPIGFIMGDVNGLKMTNDIFGHMLGDKLLETVGIVMQKTIAKENIIIRWGGDEFVIIFTKATEKELYENVEKLQENLRNTTITNVPMISVSFGVAIQDNTWNSIDDILKKAEDMMYQHKIEESMQMRDKTIYALIEVLKEKQFESAEHLERVKEHCIMMAKALHINNDSQKRLEQLAYLHDLGKVGLPFSILEKPTTLSEEEMEIVRTHTEIGYRIASNLPSLHSVAMEILYHHESWDGTGYPCGLVGEEIPLNCRIFAIIEAYDVMTHNQIYKKAISSNEALAEIQRCSGKQFDPTIVEIFKTLIFEN